MEFEWDEEKNQKNLEKHGIGFESAEEVFSQPYVKKRDERKDYGEENREETKIYKNRFPTS